MRALGSGDRHVDNDGEPDQDFEPIIPPRCCCPTGAYCQGAILEELPQKFTRLRTCSMARVQLLRQHPRALGTGSRFLWAHPMPEAFQMSH